MSITKTVKIVPILGNGGPLYGCGKCNFLHKKVLVWELESENPEISQYQLGNPDSCLGVLVIYLLFFVTGWRL
jgi:hypothetical protein